MLVIFSCAHLPFVYLLWWDICSGLFRSDCLFPCASVQLLNHVPLSGTPWTVAHQAPLSKEFSRQNCWSRLPFPTLGDLPNPGIKPLSLASPALAGGFFTTAPLGKSFVFLLLGFKSSFYVLDNLSGVSFANIFPSLWLDFSFSWLCLSQSKSS